MADYADADPAVVKSGRMKKAFTNAVEKEGEFTYSNVWSLDSVINVVLSPPSSSKVTLRPGSVAGGCGGSGVFCSQCESRCFGQQQ